jgi:hypothetical protein
MQQTFLEASATPNMDTGRTETNSGALADIYGITIPLDLCEDALANFASNVNGFMEAKFEVSI